MGAQAHGTGSPVPGKESDGPVWLEREALHMGTTLRIRARADSRELAARAIEAAFDSVDAVERRLSSWRDDTELGRLRAEGRAALEPATVELIESARRWTRSTDGAFDPTVGALVEAWDLRGEGRRPTRSGLASARAASGWVCFEVYAGDGDGDGDGDGSGEITARCADAWIDAGAFGKGAALEVARAALRVRGAPSGLLDFGGQLVAFGPDASDRRVSVAHPEHRNVPAVRLELDGGSLATTSASERFVVVRDTVRAHVIDPRTGEPAPAWGAVTVHAAEPTAADVLSTALFVMGPREGLAWAEARDGVAALFLRAGRDGLEISCDREMEALIVEVPERASNPDAWRSNPDTWKGC